jgi:methylmalonyl-CoA epimerase
MIKDVHHVGIAVRSLDEALAFYRDALGLPLVKEGVASARGVRAVMLGVGRSYLEILEPFTDESPFAKHIAERGEGLHHVALWTDDVESQVAALRDAGVPLEDREPRDGFTGRLSYLAAEAFDGALLEVVEPEIELKGQASASGYITRIDHVVLRVLDVDAVCSYFQEWFDVPTKRTFERGATQFAFLRPGDVVIEVIGPHSTGSGQALERAERDSGRISGLAFEVKGIDELAASLRQKGYPVGEPHAALQGGRIVSVHHSGACGVPVAFIDFSASQR